MTALPKCPACTGELIESCVHGSEVDRAFRALADLPAAKQRALAAKQHKEHPDQSQDADVESGEAYDRAGAPHKISGRTVRRLETVARLAPKKLDDIRERKISIARAYLDVRNVKNDHGSKADSDTYFTPRHIIDAIAAHVGPIDFDPCTTTRNWVGATHFCSLQRAENGLEIPWHVAMDGTPISIIYVNPPYNNGGCLQWVKRAHEQHIEHRVKVVLLVPATTGSEHAQYALAHATSIHYLRERLNFLGVDEKPTGSAPFDCMLVGFGADLEGICVAGVTR